MNFTKYVFGEIVAVDQIDSGVTTAATEKTVKISSDLLYMDADAAEETKVAATHIVLMSGDDLGTTPTPVAVALTSEYTITFVVDGATTSTATTDKGIVTAPTDPTKDGYTFKGWATTENGLADDGETSTIVDLATNVFAADDTLYAIFEANAPAVTVTFVNGATSTTLAVDKLSELTKPSDIALADANPTDGETYALSSLSFLGWTDEAESETVYLHDIADMPAYEDSTQTSKYNPSGATYKTVADLAAITESITLYAKYDTGYVYGDVTGDGLIKPADRLGVNAYLSGTKRNHTGEKLFPLVVTPTDNIAVAGDVTGDSVIKPADRLGVNAHLSGTKRNYTNEHVYYINK